METYIIQRDEIISQYGSSQSIQKILDDLQKKYWKKGQVICSIYLDDRLVESSEIFEKLSTGSQEYKELKIQSKDLDLLLSDTVIATKEQIMKLFKFTEGTLVKYESEDFHYALKDFVEILDNSKYIYESLSLLHSHFENKSFYDTSRWTHLDKRFLRVLNELQSSFQTEDYVLQADVIEYEFLELLNECYSYLEQIHV